MKKNLLYIFLALHWQGLCYGNSPHSPKRLDVNYKPIHKIIKSSPFITKEGRTIEMAALGNQDAPYRFFIQGGLHGNENLPPLFVRWLAERFHNEKSLLNQLNKGNVAIDFLAEASPDSVYHKSRYNKNLVNLNRNYGVLWGITKENPGSEAFSEIETKVTKALFAERNYIGSVDVHGYVPWIVAPSPPYMLENTKITTSRQRSSYSHWMKFLKEQTQKLPSYQLKTAGGLGDGGSFEDWAFWDQSVYTLCLEMKYRTRWIPQKQTKGKLDTYAMYENFIFQAFAKAIELRGINTASQLSNAKK